MNEQDEKARKKVKPEPIAIASADKNEVTPIRCPIYMKSIPSRKGGTFTVYEVEVCREVSMPDGRTFNFNMIGEKDIPAAARALSYAQDKIREMKASAFKEKDTHDQVMTAVADKVQQTTFEDDDIPF